MNTVNPEIALAKIVKSNLGFDPEALEKHHLKYLKLSKVIQNILLVIFTLFLLTLFMLGWCGLASYTQNQTFATLWAMLILEIVIMIFLVSAMKKREPTELFMQNLQEWRLIKCHFGQNIDLFSDPNDQRGLAEQIESVTRVMFALLKRIQENEPVSSIGDTDPSQLKNRERLKQLVCLIIRLKLMDSEIIFERTGDATADMKISASILYKKLFESPIS